MKRIAMILALSSVVPGCGGTRRVETDPSADEQSRQILTRYEMPASQDAATRGRYRDLYLHVQDWRQAVLDHADRATLESLRVSCNARIRELEARDTELAAKPPYVVVDARRDVREQVALEVEKLRLIQAALPAR